jgi:hypothetical protein
VVVDADFQPGRLSPVARGTADNPVVAEHHADLVESGVLFHLF